LDYRLYWRRSLIGAVAARATAERIGWSGREEAFLAGLLQDIGMVALYQAWPEPYGPLLDAQAAHPDLIVLEKERIGADHAEIGAWLLQHWRLPERLRFAVAGSHDPELSGAGTADQPLVECVALSGRIADTWLAEDRATILSETQAQAQVRLGLDDAQLLAILEAVGEELPPVAAVFEFESPTPAQIKGLLYAAQEVLIVRNLQVLHDAQEAKRKADVLETRTRVLEEQTRRDALTGLFNRVHLDQVLEEEFQLAAEQQGSLSLAFLDLDHFKLVNDTYGHQAGDAVLVAFSRLVDTQVRRCDSVARYGGEEFIVVLPGVDASPAEAVCQRIVKHIAANLRAVDPAGGISLPVTCSIGLATFSRESPFEDPNGLIRAADRALYVAKQAGRNRVATYSPP
jgi:diguanylate cyclase (GGDEF)-like protein